MPLHNWTRVDAGLFHHFRQRWISSISDNLNTGGLPAGYYALAEQKTPGLVPDVLTLERRPGTNPNTGASGGVAVETAPPQTRIIQRTEMDVYAGKANRISIRHRHGDIVAVIEIVSPGKKHSVNSLKSFVEKAAVLIRQGVHLLIIDLLPPGRRDPQGIHGEIWREIDDEPFALPPDKPLTLVAYSAGLETIAYVEPVAVGDALRDMPLFLDPQIYVPVPLEATYSNTWTVCPEFMKEMLEPAANEV